MRCFPLANNSALEKFNNHLRMAVTSITNAALSNAQWLQASVPIKRVDLGVRRVTSLSAFIGLGDKHCLSPGTNTGTISLFI